jgi:hypothetical protein
VLQRPFLHRDRRRCELHHLESARLQATTDLQAVKATKKPILQALGAIDSGLEALIFLILTVCFTHFLRLSLDTRLQAGEIRLDCGDPRLGCVLALPDDKLLLSFKLLDLKVERFQTWMGWFPNGAPLFELGSLRLKLTVRLQILSRKLGAETPCDSASSSPGPDIPRTAGIRWSEFSNCSPSGS